MSDHIATIAGLNLPDMGHGLCPELHVNAFGCGRERGVCSQITIGNSFVQLDAEGVRQLRAALARVAKHQKPAGK